MHADGKSTLASVSKWKSGRVNWPHTFLKAYVFSWNENGNTKLRKVIFLQTGSSISHENSFQI